MPNAGVHGELLRPMSGGRRITSVIIFGAHYARFRYFFALSAFLCQDAARGGRRRPAAAGASAGVMIWPLKNDFVLGHAAASTMISECSA